jgi:hypothetical protein
VLYKGGLLDVEKLMGQLKRSEKARTDTEQKMLVLKEELSGLKETATKSANTVNELSAQLQDYKEKLRITDQDLAEVKVYFVVCKFFPSFPIHHHSPIILSFNAICQGWPTRPISGGNNLQEPCLTHVLRD